MRNARPIRNLRGHQSLKHRHAGAAMVEATIVVPVFIVLLIGATYLRQLYVVRAETRLTARRCAYVYAIHGCRGRLPEECREDPPAAWAEAGPDIARTARVQAGGDVDPFSDVPVLGEAFRMLFGTSTRAIATAQVPFPFDAERVGIARGEVVVLCNSLPTDVFNIARDWLCDPDRLNCS
jgi:hypothetical protein